MSEHEYDNADDADDDGADYDDYDDDNGDDDNGDDDDDAFDDEVAPEGNRIVGASALSVLEYVTKNIVDDPDAVFIDTEESGDEVSFNVHVAPDDMGRVIGKRGRVAQAIRAVVGVAAYREGITASVEFVD